MNETNENSVLFSLDVEESPDFHARMRALADAVDTTQSRIGATIKAIADGTITEAKRIDRQTRAIGLDGGTSRVTMATNARSPRLEPTSRISQMFSDSGGFRDSIRDVDDLSQKVETLSQHVRDVGSESSATDWVKEFRSELSKSTDRVADMQDQLANIRLGIDAEPVSRELRVLRTIFDQIGEVAKQPAFEEWSAIASQNVEATRQEIERLRQIIADPIELQAATDSGELETMFASLSAKTKEITQARDRHAESLINEAEAYGRTSSRLEMFQKQLNKFGEETPDWPKIHGTKEMMDAVVRAVSCTTSYRRSSAAMTSALGRSNREPT